MRFKESYIPGSYVVNFIWQEKEYACIIQSEHRFRIGTKVLETPQFQIVTIDGHAFLTQNLD